jgi:hypothetical protein
MKSAARMAGGRSSVARRGADVRREFPPQESHLRATAPLMKNESVPGGREARQSLLPKREA